MNGAIGAILCGAYLLGLLSTGLFGIGSRAVSWQDWGWLCLGWILLGLGAALALPRFWRIGPRPLAWLGAGIIAAAAVAGLQWRIPQPSDRDISHLALPNSPPLVVSGTIAEVPSLNRKQKVRFILNAQQAGDRAVSGRLYVTLPLLQGTGLRPGQQIRLRGRLYQPQAPTYPGAFDFQASLARRGVFAGLTAELVAEPQPPPWGWWKIRQRILRAQVRGLGSPRGQLLSSMVLGRSAVDLPEESRTAFTRAGLAHILAASGFHVSLLLGVVLALTRRLGPRSRLIVSLATLLLYVALTGIQPSVLRAALMGAAVLLAMAAERQLKPLGLLLAVATVLLLFNPLWVWDLGFQLSFLATLGLVISVPPLMQRLDWLPPAIAAAIAVPLAASVWTLPLLIYAFNAIASYSLIVNVLATPLVALLSLGGMVSAAAALAFPAAGSAIAWLLDYPLRALIGLVETGNRLPGSTWAVGDLALGQLLFVYATILGLWLWPRLQRRWFVPVLAAFAVVLLPLGYRHFTQQQIAIFPDRALPILTIRDRGKTAVIAHLDEDSARYTLLPFLRERGINRLDLAIALGPSLEGWKEISDNLAISERLTASNLVKNNNPIENRPEYQPFKIGQSKRLGSTAIALLSLEPPALQVQMATQTLLLVDASTASGRPAAAPSVETLLWAGKPLSPEVLAQYQPQVAIAPSFTRTPPPSLKHYTLDRANPLQWTPQQNWQTLSEPE